MENLLKIVEEPFSAVIEIDSQFFITQVKIWDYASLSLNDYQKLSVEDRSSILKNIMLICAIDIHRFQVYFVFVLFEKCLMSDVLFSGFP